MSVEASKPVQLPQSRWRVQRDSRGWHLTRDGQRRGSYRNGFYMASALATALDEVQALMQRLIKPRYKRLVMPTDALPYGEDVEQIRDRIQARGYDADPLSIRWAYQEFSLEQYRTVWFTPIGELSVDQAADEVIARLCTDPAADNEAADVRAREVSGENQAADGEAG